MNRVAIGILAAVLGAGCALEAGDPAVESTESHPGEVTTASGGAERSPMIRSATSPAGASSAGARENPEPSPWYPDTVVSPGGDGTEQNPEPSPWRRPGPNAAVQSGGSGNSQSGTSSAAAAPDHPVRIGHWDLKDTAATN
jgi:hypothetical protein